MLYPAVEAVTVDPVWVPRVQEIPVPDSQVSAVRVIRIILVILIRLHAPLSEQLFLAVCTFRWSFLGVRHRLSILQKRQLPDLLHPTFVTVAVDPVRVSRVQEIPIRDSEVPPVSGIRVRLVLRVGFHAPLPV